MHIFLQIVGHRQNHAVQIRLDPFHGPEAVIRFFLSVFLRRGGFGARIAVEIQTKGNTVFISTLDVIHKFPVHLVAFPTVSYPDHHKIHAGSGNGIPVRHVVMGHINAI